MMDTRWLVCCFVLVCVSVGDDTPAPAPAPAPTPDVPKTIPNASANESATQNATGGDTESSQNAPVAETKSPNATATQNPPQNPPQNETETEKKSDNSTLKVDTLNPGKPDDIKDMSQKETETPIPKTETKTETETDTSAQEKAESELSKLNNGQAVDDDHELLLTPWWDLEMGEEETVEVDCGVFTDGKPETMTLQWLWPNGTAIEETKR